MSEEHKPEETKIEEEKKEEEIKEEPKIEEEKKEEPKIEEKHESVGSPAIPKTPTVDANEAETISEEAIKLFKTAEECCTSVNKSFLK